VGSGFKSRGVHGKSSYFSRELDFLMFWTFPSRTEVLDLWKGQSAQNALLAPSVKSITSKQSGCMQVFLK